MSDSKLNLHSFFITPIFSFPLEGYLNLKDEILQFKKEDQIGLKGKSTNGGWHSKDTLHEHDKFQEFKSEIFNFADEAFMHLGVQKEYFPEITGMWGIVNPPGSSNKLHNHPYNFMSGVYYLQVPEDSGRIVFHDPKPQAEVLSPPRVENHSIHVAHRVNFKPQNGTLLLFPSYVNHEVEENNSQEDRIIVSFNINFKRR
jgi:uncharacterized protein (TIGR02466 family)|tara:strand:- start:323 stop:922 length:600 start_codon:yes stop_codon:yes gene_type:complete